MIKYVIYYYYYYLEEQMRIRKFMVLCFAVLLTVGLTIPAVQAKQESRKNNSIEALVGPELFRNLTWRNIGPANMMGRVTDVEGVPGDPNIVYVGTASGGIWKTVNGGVT